MVKQNVQVIYYALGIIVFFLVLIGYKSIPEFINDIKPTPSEEEPFSISISPLFINEKQSEGYNDLPVTFTLNDLFHNSTG